MEFKNIRLGPALKIIGYSSYLRAKSRITNMKNQNKPKTELKNERNLDSSSLDVKEQVSVSQIENVFSLNGTHSPPYDNPLSQSSTVTITRDVNVTSVSIEQSGSTVSFQNFPVQHHIDDVIPVHNEVRFSPKISVTDSLHK